MLISSTSLSLFLFETKKIKDSAGGIKAYRAQQKRIGGAEGAEIERGDEGISTFHSKLYILRGDCFRSLDRLQTALSDYHSANELPFVSAIHLRTSAQIYVSFEATRSLSVSLFLFLYLSDG